MNGSVVELDGTPAEGARVALYAERAGPAAEEDLEARSYEAIAAAVSSFEPAAREIACRALGKGRRLELVTATVSSASAYQLTVPRPLGRYPGELVSLVVVASAGEGETFRVDTVL
ncbi:MAG TPA: hypothetical protein VFF73_19325, partial [Planctomycetota bacterium]|nr:hypothetical protein [Planctomycetota bacterium]